MPSFLSHHSSVLTTSHEASHSQRMTKWSTKSLHVKDKQKPSLQIKWYHQTKFRLTSSWQTAINYPDSLDTCKLLCPLNGLFCKTTWASRRAGSVWIFQIQFDSVGFSISSTGFVFFGFGLRTSPQRRRTQWVKRPQYLKLCKPFHRQLHACTIITSCKR